MACSNAHKEDRVRSVANDNIIFGPGKFAIHLRCPHVLRMRDLADAKEMGLGWSLLVVVAVLASVFVS